MKILKYKYEIVSLVVVMIGSALRFYNLGDTSLWLDEAVYSNNSYVIKFEEYISNTRDKNSSPIILPFMLYMLGDYVRTEFTARIIPALFGIFSIILILALPKVGVRAGVALIVGFWMALSPIQINYSQELREYSMGVFITTCLLYSIHSNIKFNFQNRKLLILAILVFLGPIVSYGLILVDAAILAFIAIYSLACRKILFKEMLILTTSTIFSIITTYFLTAKYQMYVGKSAYLASAYPEKGKIISWSIDSFVNYTNMAITQNFSMQLIFILLILNIIYVFNNRKNKFDYSLLILFLTLVYGSIFASILGLYPFGSIRQQLFATPLILIMMVNIIYIILEKININRNIVVVLFFTYIASICIPQIPIIYREITDIKSPLRASKILESNTQIKDENVYVYYAAQPAINFYVSKKRFYMGKSMRGNIDGMTAEIINNLPGCEKFLIFSHIYLDEDQLVKTKLVASGYKVIEEYKAQDANIIKINNCSNK